MTHVRPYAPNDLAFIISLAPRLTIGMQGWRDPQLWIATVESWLTESINQHGRKTMVFVAENEQDKLVGFATVPHSVHFTGQPQAYIGELAASETEEGRGVGKVLLYSCEKRKADAKSSPFSTADFT